MMEHSTGQIDRRSYLKTTGLATAGMIGLAGCTGDGSEPTDDGDGDGDVSYGTLSTSVTDQPSAIGDFESLTVTVDGVWIKPAESSDDTEETDGESEQEGDDETTTETTNETTDETGNESESPEDDESVDTADDQAEVDQEDSETETDDNGRYYIEFDESQDADLVQLQGSNTQLIDETDVEAREYQFLQLDVSNTKGVLTDGSDATVETPGNAPLKFNTNFEVRPDEQTRFIADFAPNKKGNGGYVIRPVATSTQVLYGDEEYSVDDESTDETDDDSTGNETDGNETAGSNSSDTEMNDEN